MKKFGLFCAVASLAACETTTTAPPAETKPAAPTKSVITQSTNSGIAGYQRVARRVEPVAERVCRDFSKDQPVSFCDFRLEVDRDTRQAPNAYQSIGRDGRPVITFNVNMLRTVKNDDEIAFIMGHEAGHQIARHLLQKRSNAQAGAILGAVLVAAAGGDPTTGADIGGLVGAQSYSKQFELQADRIGAHISSRAGYNPLTGAKSFDRTGGSNNLLSTHPPGADRYNTVVQTVKQINAAKASGRVAPVVWK